ncbi:splicing factor, proline- and glutamine-rich-like [Oenanthe melanoleuca]|uniref:splicing factor, proline- and glutamine-rich-like n=1 Tax=Oenanthe melanoleuca TaxID=2939378 RepID=UPI0024C14300|nr:splicing factor, proline- and glutamine-rich-like [Oenanthe melanoleuca]
MPPRPAESRAPAAARSGAARPRGARHAWPERTRGAQQRSAAQPSPERLRRALPPPLPAPPPRRPAKAVAGGGGGEGQRGAGPAGGCAAGTPPPALSHPRPAAGTATGTGWGRGPARETHPGVPALGGDRDRDCPGNPTPGCWDRDCPGRSRIPGLGGGNPPRGAGTERGPGGRDRDRPGDHPPGFWDRPETVLGSPLEVPAAPRDSDPPAAAPGTGPILSSVCSVPAHRNRAPGGIWDEGLGPHKGPRGGHSTAHGAVPAPAIPVFMRCPGAASA